MSVVGDLPGTWNYLRKPELTVDDNGNGGWMSSLAFSTTFDNLSDFLLTIAGTSTSITAGSYTFDRIVPLQHPLFPGLWARRIRSICTGSATDDTLAGMYSHVKVFVDFESVLYGLTGDQAYSTLEIDSGAVYTTHPGRKLHFPSGEPLDQDAGSWSSVTNYVYTIYQCISLNDSALVALQGTVNDDTFLSVPAGQLLFGTVKANIGQSVGGVTSYQRTLTLSYRSYPWNDAFQSDGTTDTPVDPASNPVYTSADFATMLN